MGPRIAVIGANGHGRWHRRAIASLHDSGRVELVALVDVRPLEVEPAAPVPRGTAVFTDHREMLRVTRPDVVVVCTPPHTHLPISLDVLAAGADLLLEKPPVLSMTEHRRLEQAASAAGLACQVGFQALGSAALDGLLDAVRDGRLGAVDSVTTIASWQRSDGYYARAPWAGRRQLDGRPVLDGALANPLAHAVMQSLAVAAVAGAPAGPAAPVHPVLIELERYRVRKIEVDDTAVLRVTSRGAPQVLVAVTLAGEAFIRGEVIVHGAAGRAVLEYPTDRLLLPGDDELREVPGRQSLLVNLIEHRADRAGVPLIAPLSRTAAFTTVLEAVQAAPEPELLDGDLVRSTGESADRVCIIRGINKVLRKAAETGALPSELGVPWAVRPHRVEFVGKEDSD